MTERGRARGSFGSNCDVINECPFNYRLDGSLLNGRWLLESVCVDTTKKVLPQAHRVEGGDDLNQESVVSCLFGQKFVKVKIFLRDKLKI